MPNPFEDKQDTTGGKAGFAAFGELTSDKAYDDETLKQNPGSPLPPPVENPPDEFTEGVRQIQRPDYEGIQLKKFTDLKKSAEALDFIFEDEYIKEINRKKSEIVTINGNAFAAINSTGVNYPSTNQKLISTTSDCPSDPALANNEKVVFDSVEPTGLVTFIYPSGCDVDATTCSAGFDCCLVGVKGKIYPDVLAAFHYPVLSNDSHGSTDLPTANGTFTIVSKDKTGSSYYFTNTLGIGVTLRLFNDNVTQSVTQSETAIGDYYFFGDDGDYVENALAGAATSISALINEINDIRASLKVRIGPPEVANNAGVNTLRSSKHREELDTWFIEAGRRTENTFDYQGGMDSLVGNASSISSYNL